MKVKLLLPALIVLPLQLAAQQPVEAKANPHTVFYSFGIADIDYSGKDQVDDFDNGAVQGIGYRYQINDTFAATARYIKSESLGFKQVVSLGALDATIDYSALVLSGQARYELIKNGFVYGELGVSHYQWDFTKQGPWTSSQQQKNIDKSGVGAFMAIGAKYQWSRVELAIENQWLTMGDVKTSNFGASIGYRF